MDRESLMMILYIIIAVLLVFVVAWMVFVFSRNRKLMRRKRVRISRFRDLVGGRKKEDDPDTKRVHEQLDRMGKEKGSDQDWQEFYASFENLYPGFLVSLGTVVKNLSQDQIRLCILIKLGMSTRQIARVMHTTNDSVSKEKQRLREKMGLPGDRELYQFIQGF
ncbi:MAG: hypothetical protein R6U78_02725 [Bacteroidales bacterium]